MRSRVPARAAFGVLLLGYSTVATVLVVRTVAAPLLAGEQVWGIDAGSLLGLLLALILTVGQWIMDYQWIRSPCIPCVSCTRRCDHVLVHLAHVAGTDTISTGCNGNRRAVGHHLCKVWRSATVRGVR